MTEICEKSQYLAMGLGGLRSRLDALLGGLQKRFSHENSSQKRRKWHKSVKKDSKSKETPVTREFFTKASKMTEIYQKGVKIEGDAFHKRILHKSITREFFTKASKMTEICQKRIKIEGDAFHQRTLYKSVPREFITKASKTHWNLSQKFKNRLKSQEAACRA